MTKHDRRRAYDLVRELLPADQVKTFDIEAIQVVSRQTLAALRLPVDVRAYPKSAKLVSGDSSWSGRAELLLDSKNDHANMTIESRSHRPRRLSVDWRTTPFEHHVLLERRESSVEMLGDRIVALQRMGGALAAVCGNGVVYVLPPGGSVERIAPSGFRTPTTAPVVLRRPHRLRHE